MTETSTHLQQALARRWRPTDFNSVIGQTQTLQALSNALTQQRLHHAYLLTGTRGVGKTTIARILAKCLNCETGITATPCNQCAACTEIDNGRFPDLYEIDAASRTKVEDTREILDNVQYAATKGRYKIYLIDEVHMLSGHSFNALLKTLEEPPEHVKFILATTDPQKLPATVLSRCLQFHLHQLTIEQISQHLTTVTAKESIGTESEALELLAEAAKGSMRDALSLLDQSIAFCDGAITTNAIRDMLGSVAPTLLQDIITALSQQNGDALMTTIQHCQTLGSDHAQVLSELLNMLHDIAIEQTIPDSNDRLDASIKQLAQALDPETVQLYYQIGLHGQRDLPFAPTPRSGFEMTLLRMLAFTPKAASSSKTVAHTVTATQTTNTSSTTTTTKDNRDWNTLFEQLQLTGTAAMLARQCSQLSHTEDKLALVMDTKHKPLLQDKHVKRIQDALQKHLQKPIKLTITLGETQAKTPAEQAELRAEAKQAAAKQAIYNDDKVQEIIKAFDATVIEGSIAPNSEN